MTSIISNTYEYISKPQERASAASRAFIGISSGYFSPGCAILGTSTAAVSSATATWGLNYIDTGGEYNLLNKFSSANLK